MNEIIKQAILAYEKWRHQQVYGSITTVNELKGINDSVEFYIKTLK